MLSCITWKLAKMPGSGEKQATVVTLSTWVVLGKELLDEGAAEVLASSQIDDWRWYWSFASHLHLWQSLPQRSNLLAGYIRGWNAKDSERKIGHRTRRSATFSLRMLRRSSPMQLPLMLPLIDRTSEPGLIGRTLISGKCGMFEYDPTHRFFKSVRTFGTRLTEPVTSRVFSFFFFDFFPRRSDIKLSEPWPNSWEHPYPLRTKSH